MNLFMVVKFVDGKKYLESDIDPVLLVYSGRKEFVVDCSDTILLDKLMKLSEEQDTFFPQIKPIVKWLEKEGIDFLIEKSTTEI